MKNYEIIAQEAIIQGLYSKDEVEQIFSTGGILPLYTYQELKKLGLQVRKGEKAVLQCKIWNHKADKEGKELTEENEYYMHKASFFKKEQADKIEVEDVK